MGRDGEGDIKSEGGRKENRREKAVERGREGARERGKRVGRRESNVIYLHSNINKVDKTECLQKVR